MQGLAKSTPPDTEVRCHITQTLLSDHARLMVLCAVLQTDCIHFALFRRERMVVVVSGMQLLRLRSAIGRHHPPQRVVLSQICCFGERKVLLFQILLDGAEPRDAGTTWLSSPVCRRGG